MGYGGITGTDACKCEHLTVAGGLFPSVTFSPTSGPLLSGYKKQLGRRNLSEEQRMYLLGKLYESRKNCHGGNRKSSRQNDDLINGPGKTVRIIAQEQGVGARTVERAEKFAQGVDALRKVSTEAAEMVLAGTAGTTKQDIAALAKCGEDDVKQMAEALQITSKEPERIAPLRPFHFPYTHRGKRVSFRFYRLSSVRIPPRQRAEIGPYLPVITIDLGNHNNAACGLFRDDKIARYRLHQKIHGVHQNCRK